MTWTGDLGFLNSGRQTWSGSADESAVITWQFSRYSDRLFPFSFYECSMNGWGVESLGYGASRSATQAVQKSFGEAWERLWLNKLASESAVGDLMTSNGFAAGKTDQMALSNSKNELIERLVMMRAWSNQSGWLAVRPRGLANRFLIWGLTLKGWETSLFNIRSNIGTVKACLIQHPNMGSIFDSSFIADDAATEEKLLISVVNSTYLQNRHKNFKLPNIGSPADHGSFYSVPENNKAFQFLREQEANGSVVECSDQDTIISKLIVTAGEFPAVARSSNPKWPDFCWGQQSIAGKNPWPHPLA